MTCIQSGSDEPSLSVAKQDVKIEAILNSFNS